MIAELQQSAIKTAFAARGVKVRLRNFPRSVRICPVGETAFPMDVVADVANALGFTNACGSTIERFSFNGSRELNAYKPGAVVRK